ncbi:unnamed protein product, partial [Adineta steineri]
IFGFYKYGFTKRIIPDYIGYIIMAILVMSWKNSIVLIVDFGFVGGITNGLLATVTFMVRPQTIVGVNNYERAAYLMTTALYFGIAQVDLLLQLF